MSLRAFLSEAIFSKSPDCFGSALRSPEKRDKKRLAMTTWCYILTRNWHILVLAGIIFFAGNLSAQVAGLAGWNIYLDPGHSQRENMGVYGYSEAEKNLRVALALRDNLLQTTDIDTVYISRTNDQQVVSLTQRTDHANSLGAAWYHSIHSDASANPSVNSTLLLWGQYRDGREKIPNGGREMSAHVVNLLTRGMRTTTRGSIGDCSFYGCTSDGPYLHVNRETTMPSELSEAGFHTNPRQNQLNMNAEWKKLEAKTFDWSILQFHDLERPAEGICAGIVSDLESGVPLNDARVKLNGQIYVTDSFTSLFYKYTNDPNLLHNGFYYFESIPNGTHQMIVEADNYKSDTLQVVVADTFFAFTDPRPISEAPPYVISTTPAPGDTNFPITTRIIINFSRWMNSASVEAALSLQPDAAKTYLWSQNKSALQINFTGGLQEKTAYTLTIGGSAQGQFGHPFDGNHDGAGGDDFVLSFKTGPADMQPPALLSVYPPNRSVNAELHPILNMRFNEALDPASVTPSLVRFERVLDNSAVAGTLIHYPVGSQSVLCFFPAQPLMPNETYVANILPGLKDLVGNAIISPKSFSFTTSTEVFAATNIDDFESNLTGNWWAPQQSGSTTGIVVEKTSRNSNNAVVNLLTQSAISMQINYGWDANAGSWLIREYLVGGPPRQVWFDNSYILQVYVFGDGSGNKFRFAVDDNVPVENAANHEVSPWYTIDWIGWRQVSWNMATDGTGTWIGDGRLDGTLRFDSIQLTYNPGSAAEGTIYFDDLRLLKKSSVGVDEPTATLPSAFALHQNYPNPFNPETTIRYQIPNKRHYVVLTIYDVMGKIVKTLVDAEQPAGDYTIHWDGKDAGGNAVASGAYLYKLTAGEFAQTKRMILIR
jgi:N-acetylmuramoyl-L-alanine amidase